MKHEKLNNERLTIPGLILLILDTGPIRGRTKLQKEVFLAWNEILGERYATDPIFHPDYFGPYSQLIVDSQAFLRSNNDIKVLPHGEGHQTFVISDKGRITLKEELEQTRIPSSLLSKLSYKKADWDEWTSSGIIMYIYRNYPYYATKSKVRELKWE